MNNKYIPTIGIEVHVELKTNNKIFSPSKNNYDSSVNTNINEIDLAYPGVLPTLNYEVVEKALLACLSLNCSIVSIKLPSESVFLYIIFPSESRYAPVLNLFSGI